MKRMLIFVYLCHLLTQLSAQEKCGTMLYWQLAQSQDPSLTTQMLIIEQDIQNFSNANLQKTSFAVVQVPVVVHVIYNTSAQNISNAQIESQITILNQDFRRMEGTPGHNEDPVGSDVQIEFYLATVDPSGNPTTGITRTSTNTTGYAYPSTDMKHTSTGGHDAWNTNKYLNLWVVNFTDGTLGYATFPAQAGSSNDGVVCDYRAFGNTGAAAYPYNMGRTASHEIGHYFNLYHTWGDVNNCNGTDYVDDTPPCNGQYYSGSSGTCDKPIQCNGQARQTENYMDYSDDRCMNLFTQGQTTRMRAIVSGARASLFQFSLIVDQKLEDNTTHVGTIGRWNGSSFPTPRLTPGNLITVNQGTTEVLQGEQVLYSGQKYNTWEINSINESDVTNHHAFLIESNFADLTSQFKTAHNATLQAQLLDGGNPSGAVDFKDPWLIDYADPNFGNNLRNQGMSAPLKSVAYATNNLGTSTIYKGVFLNQSFSGSTPYYTVNAPAEQTFGSTPGYFSHWTGSNVTYQVPTSAQTPVVFTASGATAIANYKGHLLTNSTSAIASNSQRKVIQDDLEMYHLVYESGGNIYASLSDDYGATWSPEVRVNTTLGNCFSPSITYNPTRQKVLISWLQDIQSVRYAVVADADIYDNSWTQIQSIAAPNAQQLQISSMTTSSYAPDVLVWREGTAYLKGTLRRGYSGNTFGTVRTLRWQDNNYITGFSLGAFGRTDRWDIVWTENNSLCYSSIYDDVYFSQPVMDLGAVPAVVASGDYIENANPSIAKVGSVLVAAWEAFDVEINDRNIKVVTITPNEPGYPSISAATVFSDPQVWASRYYTPSITSHYNNNLSLSWKASSIYSTKRVNGSWQSVTSLGSGVDPSAGERVTNTQGSTVHFRRGTTLPYALTPSTISTGEGMQKSEGGESTAAFAGEGSEIAVSSAKGTSRFVIVDAKTGARAIPFVDINDSPVDIRTVLRSKPFVPSGELSLRFLYKNKGELPPLRKVRVLLEEVNASGTSIRTLGIAKEYEGIKTSKEIFSISLPKTEQLVRIIIDPVLRDDSMKVELSKWYIVNAPDQLLEKSGEEKQARVLAPAVLDLLQNYPNPFNPVTTIEFTVPNNGHAKLSVYNSLGQNVATLFDGVAESGYVQKATFDGSRLASGVYFSRLEFDGKTMMKKLLLMK